MSRIQPDSLSSPNKSNAATYSALQSALGVVPNMTLAMGASPAVLQSWAHFNGAMNSAELSAATRELIAVMTAQHNDCEYCLAAHSALGAQAGLSADDLEAARDANAADPHASAALAFAHEVIQTRGEVGDASLASARAAGLTDQDLAEVVGAVALNTFTNYFNRAFQPELDFPKVAARRSETTPA